jgi:hypothetical protein
VREISRLLKLSRNTVRRILRDRAAAASPPCEPQTLARLEDAFARAGGKRRAHPATARRGEPGGRLQHLDALDQRGGAAPPAAARGRISLCPRTGDAARHLGASPDDGGQADHRAVRRLGPGLFAPAVRSILSALHPLRGQALPARGGAPHGPVCVIENTSVILAAGAGAEAVIAPRCRRLPARWAFPSAPTGSDIPTARGESSGHLPMWRETSCPREASGTSRT